MWSSRSSSRDVVAHQENPVGGCPAIAEISDTSGFQVTPPATTQHGGSATMMRFTLRPIWHIRLIHQPPILGQRKLNDAAQSGRSTNPRHLLCNSISGIMKSSRLQYGRAGWLPFFYVHFRIESSLPFLCGNLSYVTTISSNPTTLQLSSRAHYSAVLHVANWFAGNKICRAYFPSTRLWCIVHIWTRFYKVHSATSKSSNVEK